jgi:hypothetical protein
VLTPIRPSTPRDHPRSWDDSALTAVRARTRTKLTPRVRVLPAIHTAPPATGER